MVLKHRGYNMSREIPKVGASDFLVVRRMDCALLEMYRLSGETHKELVTHGPTFLNQPDIV